MKAVIETGFADEKTAEKALRVLKSALPEAEDEDDKPALGRASLKVERKGKNLCAEVNAKDFTALRARVTSLFRDLRIIYDAEAAARGSKGR
ncbi:MAG: KEOPS complex subunit Pcc1 [Candidatus Micrarchaeota archaeon]